MKIKKTIILLFAVTALFTQCKKDKNTTDSTTPTTTDSTKTVVMDVHLKLTSWAYYSFKRNAEVTITNSSDTLGWDLGVHYQTFRTNGGTSGKGQGEVLDLGAVDFTSVTMSSIGNKAFTLDDTIAVIDSMTNMGPVMANTPGSVPLGGMFAIPQGPPPHTYTPNNHVYIIRTATGRYVKFLGISFFNDLGAEGYFNFKYEFLN